MSKAVGLPAGIAAALILRGEISLTGCQLPTHPAIYPKVLDELRKSGLAFEEKVEKTP